VHNRSLALYAKLGFSVQESLACVQGLAVSMPVPGYAIRSATLEDIAACDALCRRVHGNHRHGEVAAAVHQNGALVVEHDGRISGYHRTGVLRPHLGETKISRPRRRSETKQKENPAFLTR
jgi:hypothetical protein